MLIETFGDWDMPCYITIYRRFQALKIKRNGSMLTVTSGGTALVRLAVNPTGLKQHNRGRIHQFERGSKSGTMNLSQIKVPCSYILKIQPCASE